MTEAQGRLLRRHSEQVILGYDADGAGQAAILRGMEILQNLGCDIRVLQIEGAKDPDEYVVKYGPERFQKCVEKSISLVEFKVKVLKKENTNDKIKFLNEIAKILAKITNQMEREIYVDRLSKEYKISKEAIKAEVNKLMYKNNSGSKKLEKKVPIAQTLKEETQVTVSQSTLKRENMVIYLLINENQKVYEKLKAIINLEDFKDEQNKQILKKLYEELEKGNINTNHILDWFEEEKIISHITEIMAYDFEITDVSKAIEDLISIYEKEKLTNRRNAILKQLENIDSSNQEEIKQLENELNDIILKLAKIK